MTAKFSSLRWASFGKRVRNTVIFAPLESESLEVCAAGHGIVGRSSQWANGKIIKEAFQGTPVLMTSVVSFHYP